jgi:polar amino acid transport system substrate-binding protein
VRYNWNQQTIDYQLFSEEEEMKFRIVLVLVIVLGILLAGCQQAGEDTVLEKIQTANKVVVGTSADYPPYEYIDETGKMVGFDIELMEEIAKRMDVALEWQDMPFDSLIAAVQEGKIDMSISCFNYSEERDQLVDFSDPYYTSQDAFIVTDSFAGPFNAPEDAANFKVGVQSGTVQDEWLTAELVDTGLMSEANLSRYERVDQAALDLQVGRIDILMADDVPAQAIVSQYEGLSIIYQGMLYTGPINIVLPDGAADLQAEVNRIIAELEAEGFIDTLAVKYFSE